MDKDQIRAIFMAYGFTVKEGQDDLKPYVYEAAEALLRAQQRVLWQWYAETTGEWITDSEKTCKWHASVGVPIRALAVVPEGK